MKKHIGIVTTGVILLLAANLPATIIELPLNCAGTYDTGPGWSVDFDLGDEFTDISHVYIDWSGEITAARAVYYNNPNDSFIVPVGITTHIGNPPNWKHTDFWGGESTYPNAQTFDVKSEYIYGKMPWSELYDGKGNMKIYYSAPGLMEGYIIENGLVTLNNAKLIIDGTLVPEPTTIFLLAIGVGGIIMRKKMF